MMMNNRPRGRPKAADVAARRKAVGGLAADMTINDLAAHFDVPTHIIRADLRNLRMSAKAMPKLARSETISQKKERRAIEKRDTVADRRRFKTTAVPMGQPAKLAPKSATGTLFPSRVFDPILDERILKDGSSNAKIGGDVLAGHLKGAKIFTLTLEERATCPQSCDLWDGCYGNSMQHSRRWRHGPALEARIRAEVKDLCNRNDRVLIRLHILGDFYSLAYVRLWADLIDKHLGLFVFGFTAWRANTLIGAEIVALRRLRPDRFFMRHSGWSGPWGSFTLDFPTEKARIGSAIVCPEQRDAMDGGARGMHCGACGLCWKGDTAIAFVEH
jgi:hypothetical protein